MTIRCLICGKILEPIDAFYDESWKNLFHNADTWEISCDYGSRFDTDKFVFGLCDDCIEAKVNSGLLIPNGSIM